MKIAAYHILNDVPAHISIGITLVSTETVCLDLNSDQAQLLLADIAKALRDRFNMVPRG